MQVVPPKAHSKSWRPRRDWMHCQQQRLIVQDVEMILHFGGCSRQDLLTNPPLNFIAVQNAAILGEIMVNCILSFLCL